MSTIATLRIHNAELIEILINSAEGMYEVQIDQVREMLGNPSASTLDNKEVQEGFARVAAIQEVVMKLKHASIIPPPSHKHPTIIPLSSHEQVAVVDMIIDFSWDTENDIVTEPLWGLRACLPELTTSLVDELRAEMNASIDRLVMVTELKTMWKEEMR